MKLYIKCADQTNGVFWVIDGELFSFPFYDDYDSPGVAKSGKTYNHRNLWPDIRPSSCKNLPFDYYPRGRVEIKSTGKPVVYMNPNVKSELIPDIKREFGLRQDPEIHIDNSSHYRCYLDEGYVSQDSNYNKRHR